ncbi:uncharacterized protein [Nothobranchius furzeri]|uniref:uncharacterized protein isoform X1 n=1 Tax=Nothobranchius furzeri TaxID=105023 RepID=UPI003904D8F9
MFCSTGSPEEARGPDVGPVGLRQQHPGPEGAGPVLQGEFRNLGPSEHSYPPRSNTRPVNPTATRLSAGAFVLQDLKANESRLRDINKVASELESEGLMAEEAPMVQVQQQEHLGSAPGKVHVVLRLHQNQTWCFCYHSFVCLFTG